MKLVITTQIRENYGAHDWDGVGQCPQHWRCKGGDVYVVPNLTPAQIWKIEKNGVPTLRSLIETRNHAFEETVIDWSIVDDAATVTEPWNTPFSLQYVDGRWIAERTIMNNEYGCMRREIASKTERYVMGPAGERSEFLATFTMQNGDRVTARDLVQYLAESTQA